MIRPKRISKLAEQVELYSMRGFSDFIIDIPTICELLTTIREQAEVIEAYADEKITRREKYRGLESHRHEAAQERLSKAIATLAAKRSEP